MCTAGAAIAVAIGTSRIGVGEVAIAVECSVSRGGGVVIAGIRTGSAAVGTLLQYGAVCVRSSRACANITIDCANSSGLSQTVRSVIIQTGSEREPHISVRYASVQHVGTPCVLQQLLVHSGEVRYVHHALCANGGVCTSGRTPNSAQ